MAFIKRSAPVDTSVKVGSNLIKCKSCQQMFVANDKKHQTCPNCSGTKISKKKIKF